MLWMVAPALPKFPERQERADEGADVEAEAKQTMLTENLEVDAVRVKGLVVARSEIDGPDILVPERPEPGAREGATHRYVPRRLEGLQPSYRGQVPRFDRLLFGDGAETIPESLGREGVEEHAPRGAPNYYEENHGQPKEGAPREREDDRDDRKAEGKLEDPLEPWSFLLAGEIEEDREDPTQSGADAIGIREEAHVGTEDPFSRSTAFHASPSASCAQYPERALDAVESEA